MQQAILRTDIVGCGVRFNASLLSPLALIHRQSRLFPQPPSVIEANRHMNRVGRHGRFGIQRVRSGDDLG